MAGGKKKSIVWNYFTSQGTDKNAICNICEKSLSYRATITNLKRHLQLLHKSIFDDILENESDESSDNERTTIPSPEAVRPVRSSIWIYFKKSPLGDKTASCLICKKTLSYSTTITNLKSHLQRRHLSEYEIYLENLEESHGNVNSTPNPVRRTRNSGRRTNPVIWEYFSIFSKSNKTASCNICSKTLSFRTTITNLKTHLRLLHSSDYKIFLEESSNCEEYNDVNSPASVIRSSFTDEDKEQTSEYVEILLNNEAASGSTDPLNQYSLEQHDFDEQMDEAWSPTASNYLASLEPTTSKKCKRSNVLMHRLVKQEKIDTTSATTSTPKVLQANKNKVINVMLLKLFIRTYQPFSIIEEEDFIDFVKALNPRYNLPNIKQVTDRLIPSIYEKCLEEQKQIVREQAKYVCLTTETWTSSTMEAFMAATIHFLTEELELKSVMLACSHLKGSPTVRNVVSELKSITEEWEISDKISFCVSNNDSNIVSAVKLLGWTHYSCYVTNLNIIVQKALDIFQESIDKVKIIVTHFNTSCAANERLIEYQQYEQGIARPRGLTNCDPRYWMSMYSMLEGLTILQAAVQAVMLNIDEVLPVVTKEEWSMFKQLCVVLKPFEETARILNAENYVAAGKVIVLTNGLKNVLEKLRNEDFIPKIEEMIDILSAEIDSRFNDVEFNENLALCTVLDPRFKLPAFKNKTAAGNIKATLIDKVKSLIDKERIELNGEVSESKENVKSDQFSIWNSFKESAKIMNPSQSSTSLAGQEVENFLNDSLLDLDEDPIGWWREGRPLYQHLRTIFLENCHTLVNSEPCESLFTGHEIVERRTRLATTKIRQLVFLHSNMSKYDYERLF